MQPEGDYEKILREEKVRYLDYNGKKILDVGGGSGAVWDNLNIIADTRIDLVEPDPWLSLRAERKGYYDVIVEDYPSTSLLPIDEYDVVCMMGLLEHIEDPIEFMLKYDGAKRFYLTVPNANSLHRHVGVNLGLIEYIDELGPQDLEIGHHRVYTAELLTDHLNEFSSRSKYNYFIARRTTTSLKFLSSKDMIDQIGENRIRAINSAARNLGLDNMMVGAEIVIDLVRQT
jgi:hypothetical protein